MKKLMLIFVFLCGGMLTGCVHLAELTDTESDMLSEYMAGTVLKYDKNYEDSLIYPEDSVEDAESTNSNTQEINDTIESTDTAEAEDTNETANPVNSTKDSESTESLENALESEQSQGTAQYVNMVKEIGNGNIDISFTGYELYDSYPKISDSNFYSFETSGDRQLLVITFDIKNLSDKTQSVNMLDAGLSYKLNINEGTIYKPIIPLLMNDIQYINQDIAAGKSAEAIIVFDVLRDDMSNITLLVSNQDDTAEIKIK